MTAIPRQRAAQALGQGLDAFGKRCADGLGAVAVGQPDKDHEAAGALDQRRDPGWVFAHHKVAFPVSGYRPICRLGGTLADRDRVLDLSLALADAPYAGLSDRSGSAQVPGQLAAQLPASLDEQAGVDRLVTDTHRHIIRVFPPQPPGDLLGRPTQHQPLANDRPQGWVQRELRRLRAPGTTPGSALSATCPVPVTLAVALDLPRDTRMGPPQPLGDQPKRLPGCQPPRDLLALSSRQHPH